MIQLEWPLVFSLSPLPSISAKQTFLLLPPSRIALHFVMQVPNSFKLVFLRQMLLGVRLSAAAASKGMTLQERKDAVKLSADAAMALARGSTGWTRGLIANLSREDRNRSRLKCILGTEYEKFTRPCYHPQNILRCKKIIRRSFKVCSARRKRSAPQDVRSGTHCSSILARTIVKKRTQVLKNLVPGVESMDGFSLLDETLDYVVSLKAQVDLMQHLLRAVEASKLKSQHGCTMQERLASSVGR